MSGRKAEVEYQSNIAGQAKPRDFTVKLFNEKEECVGSFRNVKPKYDEKEEIYHMNFFGRVKQASARNFQLVSVDDPEAKQIVLMHGKVILLPDSREYGGSLGNRTKRTSFRWTISSLSQG